VSDDSEFGRLSPSPTHERNCEPSTVFADLLVRVQLLTEPNRDLDGDLYWALERQRAEHTYWTGALGMPRALPANFRPTGLGAASVRVMSPAYTASLDAALGLVERVLPGAEVEITNLYGVAMATLPLNFSGASYQSCRLTSGNLAMAVVGSLLMHDPRRQDHSSVPYCSCCWICRPFLHLPDQWGSVMKSFSPLRAEEARPPISPNDREIINRQPWRAN
jgi:hypothetical protein